MILPPELTPNLRPSESARIPKPYTLNPPKPTFTFLQGPYKPHIRVYNENLQKTGFSWVKINPKP